MNLGFAIKSSRERLGLKQGQLARLVDITQPYLSQIENNRKEPNLATLESISAHLGVPLPILLFLAMEPEDVPEEKRDAYEAFAPKMNALTYETMEHLRRQP